MNSSRKLNISVFLFPLFIIATLISAWIFRDRLFALFASPARIRTAIESAGPWGVVLFIAMQVLQVVVFILPGEVVQVAGGWLFGVFRGTVFSLIGITIGSIFNFAFARIFGKKFVETLFGARTLQRFGDITSSPKAAAAFFFLFVIPGIPKDVLCFIAGLSSMRLLSFFIVSMVGRLPGILGSTVMGQAASDGRYGLMITVAVISVVLFVLGAIFKDRIHDTISIRFRHGPKSSIAPKPPREEV
jgi:uncharacterized membrane protein YdjX (TVP38/TMEM64 family)